MFTWSWQESHRSDALFGVSRLDATADSNHSCYMKCPFFWTMAVTEQTETEHLSETWYQKDNVVYLALVRIWPLIQQRLRDINGSRTIKDQIDILGSLKMLQETLKTMFLVIHLDIPNQSWILNIWLWRFWCSDGDSMIFDGLGTRIGWAIRWRLLCQYDMFGIVWDWLACQRKMVRTATYSPFTEYHNTVAKMTLCSSKTPSMVLPLWHYCSLFETEPMPLTIETFFRRLPKRCTHSWQFLELFHRMPHMQGNMPLAAL